jgi:hypothetical protein
MFAAKERQGSGPSAAGGAVAHPARINTANPNPNRARQKCIMEQNPGTATSPSSSVSPPPGPAAGALPRPGAEKVYC